MFFWFDTYLLNLNYVEYIENIDELRIEVWFLSKKNITIVFNTIEELREFYLNLYKNF